MGPSGFCVFNGSVAGWNATNRTFGHEQLLYCSSQSGSMPVGSWWFIATPSQSRCWGSQTVRPCRRMTPWAMAIFLANEIRWISTNWGLCWWLLNYALHPKTVDSSSPAAAMDNGSNLSGCANLLKLAGRQILSWISFSKLELVKISYPYYPRWPHLCQRPFATLQSSPLSRG